MDDAASRFQRDSELLKSHAADRQHKRDKQRIRDLEQQVDLLHSRLDALKASRWSIPLSRRKNAKTGRPSVRLIIPDTHGCLVDVPAISAVLEDCEALAPTEVVWLGDHLECGGFLAEHWTLGYVAQTAYTFQQDVDAGNDLLDKMQARTPKARHYYLEGNHERRISTWCVTSALKNQRDAEFLLKQFGAETQLNIAKRGISYYRQGQFYDGLPVPATIKRGHCYFTHGHTAALHAAHLMLTRYGNNVVYGHTHRADESSTRTVTHGTIKAWCPGCLCQLQPLWKHTDPTTWNHGYGVQLVQQDGSFLHLTIPVIDGRSYLVGFASKLT